MISTYSLDKLKKLIKIFVLLDCCVVILHLLLGRTLHFFNLDFEHNLPTFYQSLKLILIGCLIIYFLITTRHKKKRIIFFLIPVSLGSIALGLDEMFQIHENIYRLYELTDSFHPAQVVEKTYSWGYQSSLWIVYYIPVFLLTIVWMSYWLHYFRVHFRQNFLLLILIFYLVVVIIVSELISSTGYHNAYVYYYLITIEETAELLVGTTIATLIYSTIREYQKNKTA